MTDELFIAILPNGEEYLFKGAGKPTPNYPENLLHTALVEYKITVPYTSPNRIKIPLHKAKLEKGKVVKGILLKQVDVNVPTERMTEEEYIKVMGDILKGLPSQFAGFVRNLAYEQGHASGREEICSIARDIAPDLLMAVRQYTDQLTRG